MKKTKFPSWFSHYSKPYKPYKPQEKIQVKADIIKEVKISEGDTIFPEEGLMMTFGTNYVHDDEREYCIYYSKPPVMIDNPKYDKLLEKYNKDMEEYNVKIKEWNKYKKIYDQEQEEEHKERRRKQFEALKKEFGE